MVAATGVSRFVPFKLKISINIRPDPCEGAIAVDISQDRQNLVKTGSLDNISS
jgi:hypothetical protein